MSIDSFSKHHCNLWYGSGIAYGSRVPSKVMMVLESLLWFEKAVHDDRLPAMAFFFFFF